jgi:cellobiose phosphorylase
LSTYGSNATKLVQLRQELGSTWKKNSVRFQSPSQPAVAREVAWHSSYLRQALTFYDFFNESVLDQGSQYRYASGFEGAARDPLQHVLGLLHSAPEQAASVLRMQLQQLVPEEAWGNPKPSGPFGVNDSSWNMPYALFGSGRIDPITYDGVVLNGASDLELYLLLSTSEYLLATKDVRFLSERIPYKFKLDMLKPSDKTDRSVLEVIAAAYRYLVNHTSVGRHGLLRVQSGDWNDGFSAIAGCGGNVGCQEKVQATAESVMNAAMATHVMDRLASALEMASASAHMEDAIDIIDPSIIDAASVRQFGNLQKEMLLKWAWNEGGWCDRAWLPNKGFVGSSQRGDPLGITLEPQPWVLMARVLNDSDQTALVTNVQERLQTAIGYKQAATGHVWGALAHPM